MIVRTYMREEYKKSDEVSPISKPVKEKQSVGFKNPKLDQINEEDELISIN